MYAAHFGLKEPPFTITPDPRYLFMSERHREALAHLLYGAAEGGGFVQLTGEVGTGKTTLCRCLLEQLPARVDVALILNPKLTSVELLATVCDELRISYPEGTTSPKALVDALYGYLLDAHSRGRRTVLIVDEAQDLSAEVLEQIRLLTNLETTREKLLQIILIGQPELIQLLERDDLRQLAQRITARYHLEPFTAEETRAYIRHRLQIAGRTRGLFTDNAFRRVHRESGGVPRLVNIICDRALLGAYAQDRTHVDNAMVVRAAAEVRGRETGFAWLRRWRWGVTAGAVAVLALGGAVLATRPFAQRSDPAGASKSATPMPGVTGAGAAPNGSAVPAQAALPVAGRAVVAAAIADTPKKPPSLGAVLAEPGAPTDEASAFTVLYGRWSVDGAAQKGQRGCDGAREAGFRCLLRTGNWNRLRRYDLPAILELNGPSGARHMVAIVGLAADTVTVDLRGRQLTVPLRDVEPFWDGDFTLLWKPPAVATPLAPGAKSRDVEWLRRRLADVDRGPATARRPELYDRELRDRVVSFQKSRGLEPDGVVGEETLVHLTIATREPGVPLLASARP